MSSHDEKKEIYQTLVSQHAAGLYRFAFRLCGDHEAAEDIVQETFYEAWRSIYTLRDRDKARAWIYQILRHCYAHWVRRKGRNPTAHVSTEELENMAILDDADLLQFLSRQELVQKALNALDIRYKEPFLLIFLEGLSCKETSARLKIPMGTVLSRVHRARVFLRNFLLQDREKNN